MKKNNSIEKFLSYYREKSSEEENYVYRRVYIRPSKLKCIFLFGFSLLLLFLIIRYLISPTIMFGVILIVDLLVCVYYGYNLFSKNGFVIGKTVKFEKSELEELQNDDDLVYDEEDTSYQNDEDDSRWREN